VMNFISGGGRTTGVGGEIVDANGASIGDPYSGYQINIRDTSTPIFTTECNAAMSNGVGYRLAQPLCFATNAMRETGVTFWISVILDVSMIATFFGYIWNVWVKGFFK